MSTLAETITVNNGLLFSLGVLALIGWISWLGFRHPPGPSSTDRIIESWATGGWSKTSISPTEEQILAADRAARRRVAERLIVWADACVEAGKKHRDDADRRARYGAQARALYAAANEISRNDRPKES